MELREKYPKGTSQTTGTTHTFNGLHSNTGYNWTIVAQCDASRTSIVGSSQIRREIVRRQHLNFFPLRMAQRIVQRIRNSAGLPVQTLKGMLSGIICISIRYAIRIEWFHRLKAFLIQPIHGWYRAGKNLLLVCDGER